MSPLRILLAFLDRKTAQLRELCDEGGLFELRFQRRLIEREQLAVAAAAGEASTLELTAAAIRDQVQRDLASDDDTPGMLDSKELARLQRALARLGHDATEHTAHLQQLV